MYYCVWRQLQTVCLSCNCWLVLLCAATTVCEISVTGKVSVHSEKLEYLRSAEERPSKTRRVASCRWQHAVRTFRASLTINSNCETPKTSYSATAYMQTWQFIPSNTYDLLHEKVFKFREHLTINAIHQTRWRLRFWHCAAIHKIAGLIPSGVFVFFINLILPAALWS